MSVDASKGTKITDGRSDLRVIEGSASADDVHIGIVAAKWNDTIINALLEGALAVLAEQGVAGERITVVWVPGSFEIPVAAHRMAATGQFDAIIAFGCVIRGETPHFDYVAGECARGITDVALEFGVPVMFGVLTVETLEQAQLRAGLLEANDNKGRDVAIAALEMIDLMRKLET